MKNKLKFGALALAAGIVMSSQAFAVTYAPNIDDTIKKDNVEALEEYTYTQEDLDYVCELYLMGSRPDEKDYCKYDVDKDGKINTNDAAIICDYIF